MGFSIRKIRLAFLLLAITKHVNEKM